MGSLGTKAIIVEAIIQQGSSVSNLYILTMNSNYFKQTNVCILLKTWICMDICPVLSVLIMQTADNVLFLTQVLILEVSTIYYHYFLKFLDR